MLNYVTLYQVKQQLKLKPDNTNDDELLKMWILASTNLINYWKGRRYDVYRDVIRLDTPHQEFSGIGVYGDNLAVQQLFLGVELHLLFKDFDLLEIEELLNGDGTEIASNKYILEPYNHPVKNRLFLKSNSGIAWLPDGDNEYRQAIQLTGYFGCVDSRNYFVNTGETLADTLLVDATSFAATSVAGPASDHISPRIQVGQMLRLASVNGIEFLNVMSIENNDVTVERSFNGTEAVEHPAGTVVQVFRPANTIQQVALRLAQWRYRQKDTDSFDKIYDQAAHQLIIPTALPSDVKMLLGARKVYIK